MKCGSLRCNARSTSVNHMLDWFSKGKNCETRQRCSFTRDWSEQTACVELTDHSTGIVVWVMLRKTACNVLLYSWVLLICWYKIVIWYFVYVVYLVCILSNVKRPNEWSIRLVYADCHMKCLVMWKVWPNLAFCH